MHVRIYDISKKLGLENKEILAAAKALGIAAAKVPSSSLDKITANYLEEEILKAHPEIAAKIAAPPAPEKPKAAPVEQKIEIIKAPPPEAVAPPPPTIEPAPKTDGAAPVAEAVKPPAEVTAKAPPPSPPPPACPPPPPPSQPARHRRRPDRRSARKSDSFNCRQGRSRRRVTAAVSSRR